MRADRKAEKTMTTQTGWEPPQANDLHDKYLKDRKIIQETIEYLTDL